MVCLYCGGDTQVINSRPQKRSNQVWRRRKCLQCNAVFSTHEAVVYDDAWRVREQNGQLKPFRQNKLLISLYKSLGHRPSALSDATDLTDTITAKLRAGAQNGTIEASSIAKTATVVLKHFDNPAAISYQAFHPVKS